MIVLVKHGCTIVCMEIVIVVFVPMHVFGAVIVAMSMRVTVVRMPMIVPVSFAPTLIGDPEAERDERNCGR